MTTSTTPTSRSLRVIARIRAKPDQAARTREVLRALIGTTRREPGCLMYELLQSRSDPADFVFVEEWRSDADLDAHLSTAHVKEAGARLQGIIVGAPDIRAYSLVQEEGE